LFIVRIHCGGRGSTQYRAAICADSDMRQHLQPLTLQERAFAKGCEQVGIGVRLSVLASRQFPSQRIGL
jgi:hypothetical protein